MTVVNHWGKWVSDNIPVTGVVSLGSLANIDEICVEGQVINLTYENGWREYIREKTSEFVKAFWDGLDPNDNGEYSDPEPTERQLFEWSEEYSELDQPPGTYLIGAWVQDENGLYEPGELTPENEFAAIASYDTMTAQVVRSKYAIRAELCSPCYPGQANIDDNGDFMGYDFPDWIYGDRRQNVDAVRFVAVGNDGKFWQVIAPAKAG